MNQKWEPLKGWENVYEIHPTGLVRRIGKIEPLKTTVAGAGYCQVRLSDAPRHERFYVHDLVLRQFKGPPPPGTEAEHEDRDKTNNNLDNLSWKTHKENCANRVNATPSNAKLSFEIAEHVRARIAADEPQHKLAEELGVCKQTITNIKQGVVYAKNS